MSAASLFDLRDRSACFAMKAGALITLVGALAAQPVQGADLPDPTRPPTALRRVAAGAPAQAVAPAAPVLQSVLIGEGRQPSAIINGRLLQLGDAFDEMRLTRLNETGALLSGPRGQTLLTLTPGADKQVTGALVLQKFGAFAPGVRPNATQPLSFRVAEQK